MPAQTVPSLKVDGRVSVVLVFALAPRTTTITATVGTQSASLVVTVSADPAANVAGVSIATPKFS